MSWNHRVLRHEDGTLAVYEVYYDDDGRPVSRTETPVAADGDDLAELLETIDQIRAACDLPILDIGAIREG